MPAPSLMHTLSNEILRQRIVWTCSQEEPDAVRWTTTLSLSDRTLDVNVITATNDDHRQRVIDVSVWLRRLAAKFDSNVEEILDW